jgi:hypothetical protein
MSRTNRSRSFKEIFFLLAIILNVTRVNCDINLNKTNGENLTSPLVSCNDGEKCKAMMRDRMVLVQQKFDDYLREASSVLNVHTERLKHTSFVYGLIVAAEENQLNQRCYNEIQQIMQGINRKEIWAMKSEFKCFGFIERRKKITKFQA